jgi:hypothetical protein
MNGGATKRFVSLTLFKARVSVGESWQLSVAVARQNGSHLLHMHFRTALRDNGNSLLEVPPQNNLCG